VLTHLIETGYINQITYLQIQFHDFVPEASIKRQLIRNQLSKTHDEAWCFDFIWESWVLKSGSVSARLK